MPGEPLIKFNRPTYPLLDGLDRDLGTRIKQGRPLLDRQIPGIARDFGGGWARRRRLLSPLPRRACGQHHTRRQRGGHTSRCPHALYDAPVRHTVPLPREFVDVDASARP